jgi:transcriptional regulator NrdR family protein
MAEMRGDGANGLKCPKCGCQNFRVDYTRPKDGGIMRKRFCRHCNTPLVTFERPLFH